MSDEPYDIDPASVVVLDLGEQEVIEARSLTNADSESGLAPCVPDSLI